MRDTRRSRMLLAVLVVTAFVLITVDYRTDGGVLNGLRNGATSVAGRIEKGVSVLTSPISNTLSSLANSGRDRKRVDQLSQELASAKQQLSRLDDARRQAAALARLRLVADRGGYTIVPARVTATGDQLGLEWMVTVDAGSDVGVRPGMLVINEDGLVGSTVRVGPASSDVRLACDPTSHIGARLEASQALGKVDGDRPDRLVFTLYDSAQRVRPGDRLVTFGSADYAPGVPIGTVTRLRAGGQGLARMAEVRPFVSFGTVDLMGIVVVKPPTNPGDRVLTPRPVPAATVPAPVAALPLPAAALPGLVPGAVPGR